VLSQLSELAEDRRLALAGAGSEGVRGITGVLTLTGEPVSEAHGLSEVVG